MKKIFNIFIFSILILLPIKVFATGNITVSPSSLTIEEGKTKTFTITAYNTIGDLTISSSDNSIATVSVNEWETGMVEEGQTKTGTVTITGVREGNATITLALDASTFDEEDLSGQKRTVSVRVKRISSNNNLSSIKIDNSVISGFTSSTTTYNVSTEASTINLSATAEDSTASVSGTGKKDLNYGNNSFEIKVTAENGSVKKYTVNVNRIDTRDTNNNLKSLGINPGNITFNKNTLEYKVNVDSNVEKIKITAETESTKSQLTGDGEKTLNYGENKYEIKVTAENGEVKKYTIIVNRKDNRDSNNNLKSLSVNPGNITFNKNTLEYIINVEQTVEKIRITAEAESEKSKVSGDGEKTLNYGENKYEIKVTAENETVKTYVIKVIKSDGKSDNADLASLTIDALNIYFDKDQTVYNLTVGSEIQTITINASSFSDKSKVEGIGTKELVIGNNVFNIVVTAANGTTKTYTLNITRDTEETKDSYTVIFDSNGGSECKPSSKIINNNEKIDTICVTNREGYIFKGWYTSKESGTKVDESTIINKDMILYARWEKQNNNYILRLIIAIISLIIILVTIALIAMSSMKNKKIA